MAFVDDLKFCIKPRCPVCRQGRLFKPMSVTVVDKCDHCGADLGLHDIGDGAAVFILFILCFSLIPLAWVMELIFAPPLFFHVLFSGIAGLAMIAVMLPATKAYIIMLEWRHLKHEADDPEQPAENGGSDAGGD